MEHFPDGGKFEELDSQSASLPLEPISCQLTCNTRSRPTTKAPPMPPQTMRFLGPLRHCNGTAVFHSVGCWLRSGGKLYSSVPELARSFSRFSGLTGPSPGFYTKECWQDICVVFKPVIPFYQETAVYLSNINVILCKAILPASYLSASLSVFSCHLCQPAELV